MIYSVLFHGDLADGSVRKLMNCLNQFGYGIEIKVKSIACRLAKDTAEKSQPTEPKLVLRG